MIFYEKRYIEVDKRLRNYNCWIVDAREVDHCMIRYLCGDNYKRRTVWMARHDFDWRIFSSVKNRFHRLGREQARQSKFKAC